MFKKIERFDYSDNLAFLIEGAKIAEENPDNFPGEYSIVKLARDNECRVFDAVVGGYTVELYPELFKKATEFEQKAYLYFLIAFYEAELRSWWDEEVEEKHTSLYIIEHFIEPILQKCSDLNIFAALPPWADDLIKTHDMNKFKSSFFKTARETLGVFNILKRFFFNEGITDIKDKLEKKMVHLANQRSYENLLNYLNEHKNITTVYGLIGNMHLDIANDFCCVKTSTKFDNNVGYCHAELDVKDRTVNLYLFGGVHKQKEHTERLLEHLSTHGLESSSESKQIIK
ncbi:hypothetical protein ACNVED_15085 (plasmid) [Legionella sp. D16C41]|uniref:hypothetical protein n=1 Tax=Legionella sp. D16C41 TaxID=3402688 RepID=UPI003AF5DBFC